MSESEAKEKVTKKSRKRKLTEEVPLRKSSRIANAKPASSSSADKKVSSAKSAPTKNDPDPPKKRGRGRRKAEEEDEEEASDMSEFDWENAKSVYDFTVKDIKGEDVSLEKYRGNVLLIVNVASKCGLTSSNYAQLVQLDEKFRDKGLRILAFPCNQFGGQEPGSADAICEFTKKKNVNFDLFEKIQVNGKNSHPLYKYLKREQPGTVGNFIKWNFTKFIVNKEGKPVERYASTTSPESLIPDIEKYL